MKNHIQVMQTPRRPAEKMVIHHNQKEDFTLYQNAGFVLRWYAITIDLVLFAPLYIIARLPFETTLEYLGAFGHDKKFIALSVLLLIVPFLAYFILPTTVFGRTLGKKIVGLRVVRVNCSEDLTFGQVIVRESVGKLVSAALLFIGFFMVGFNNRRRALHDYMAETVVIMYRER